MIQRGLWVGLLLIMAWTELGQALGQLANNSLPDTKPNVRAGSEIKAQITALESEVFILRYPAKGPTGPGPYFDFHGVTYSLAHAEVGDDLVPGNLLRTGPNSRVRLVYPYGDVIVLASDSFLVFGSQNQSEPHLQLIQGKVRLGVGLYSDLIGQQFRMDGVSSRLQPGEFFMTTIIAPEAGRVSSPTIDSQWLALRGSLTLNSDQQKVPVLLHESFVVRYQRGLNQSPQLITAEDLRAAVRGTDLGFSIMAVTSLDLAGRMKALEQDGLKNLLQALAKSDRPAYLGFLGQDQKNQSLRGYLVYSVEQTFKWLQQRTLDQGAP